MSSSPACFTVQQVQKSFEPQNNFGRLFSEANNLSQPFVIFRHSFVVLSRRTRNDVDKKVVLLWLGNGNIRSMYEISTPSRNVTTTNRDRLATSLPKVVSKSWSRLLARGLRAKGKRPGGYPVSPGKELFLVSFIYNVTCGLVHDHKPNRPTLFFFLTTSPSCL